LSETEPDDETFELDDSKHVLNLDYYLHRSIVKWQDALESAIKLGKLEDGLVSRGLAAEMVVGCAVAKGLVHWEKQDVPAESDKSYNVVIGNNKDAEEFEKKFNDFKADIEKNVDDKNICTVRIADFKVFEILKNINKSASKHGKVII